MESNFESNLTPEQAERSEWDQVFKISGFVESPEMEALRTQSAGEGEGRSLLWNGYRDLAETAVNALDGDNFFRGQIGLDISMARLQWEAGEKENAKLDLQETYEYARRMGYEDIADAALSLMKNLESEDSIQSRLIEVCSEVLDQNMLDDLRECADDEVLNNAFTFLEAAGVDAESFLKEKGLLQ